MTMNPFLYKYLNALPHNGNWLAEWDMISDHECCYDLGPEETFSERSEMEVEYFYNECHENIFADFPECSKIVMELDWEKAKEDLRFSRDEASWRRMLPMQVITSLLFFCFNSLFYQLGSCLIALSLLDL